MEISIRRAMLEDVWGVLRCLREAFEEYRDRYTTDAYLDTVPTVDTLRERVAAMHVFLAVRPGSEVSDGEIMGTVGCAVAAPGEGHLRGLAVRPAWQGNGVAARLLQAAEAELRDLKCSRVTLDTTAVLQGAIQFYEGRGYRRTDRVKDFFAMELYEYA